MHLFHPFDHKNDKNNAPEDSASAQAGMSASRQSAGDADTAETAADTISADTSATDTTATDTASTEGNGAKPATSGTHSQTASAEPDESLHRDVQATSAFRIDDIFTITKEETKTTMLTGFLLKGSFKEGDTIFQGLPNGRPVMTCKIGSMERIGRDSLDTITYDEKGGNANAYGIWIPGLPADAFRKGNLIYKLQEREYTQNPDKLSQERKEELSRFLFGDSFDEEQLAPFCIQDICFLLCSLNQHKNDTEHPVPSAIARQTILLNTLYQKLLHADALYLTIDLNTNMPFINAGTVDVYSKESFAQEAADHYRKEFHRLSVMKISREHTGLPENMGLFAWLYFLGTEFVMIDNGQFKVGVDRGKILPPPDYTGTPEAEIPLSNPALRFAMNACLGELRWPVQYEKREEQCRIKEQKMLDIFSKSRFLVPARINGEQVTKGSKVVAIKKDGTISVPHIKNKQGEEYIAYFTDWMEFHKLYKKEEWNGLVVPAKEVLTMDASCGSVINPLGENLVMTPDRKKELLTSLFSEDDSKNQ